MFADLAALRDHARALVSQAKPALAVRVALKSVDAARTSIAVAIRDNAGILDAVALVLVAQVALGVGWLVLL
eukprot:CAMPEP_0202055898 /NCGR_PEP_ID=MMETSP0963-20130614/21102_1 /ASSEMBLY_ACC=CAM_ASM_000494 /TAXON_ID=4773 /ORGANISM="Schizochytrium aggregatum, Strain ATCC28209" /LENGTH=71 /DNA_ID=CAMNT_0048621557 /DNA_START=42 /DNA_END=253 /DNA_ORIENTATION=-